MSDRTDLTRWNRAGLRRFRYVDGNAPVFLELVREHLAARFGGGDAAVWQVLHDAPLGEGERERLDRLLAQYDAERRDLGWEIVRALARATHVLTSHVDAYANEGFLGTATQWDNVRRLVEMLDYHPAPPASAATSLALVAKPGARGTLARGFQIKHTPASGPPVVFETLEEVVVDAALNELRPEGHDRDPTPLGGSTLLLEEAMRHIRTGEPVVLEDERTGGLRAHLVQGVLDRGGRTEVTVHPPLDAAFAAGYTVVHAHPGDRLRPRGPTEPLVAVGRTLRLAQPAAGLAPGDVVYVTDGPRTMYRRLAAVEGSTLVLDRDAGPLHLDRTTVAPPEFLPTVRLPEDDRSGEREVRVAGDRSGLAGRVVALRCVASDGASLVVQHRVTKAEYTKPVTHLGSTHAAANVDPEAGHTLLALEPLDDEARCASDDPPAGIHVPPPAARWPADPYLERTAAGALAPALTVDRPKKTAAGDVAVVVRGGSAAWARLGAVEADLDAGEATLTPDGGWTEVGGGDYHLGETVIYSQFRERVRLHGWGENDTPLTGSVVPIRAVPDALRPGTRLVVTCPGADAYATTIARVQPGAVTLAHPLPPGCTAGGLALLGNVVSAGHGESKSEKVLGSGSAARSNQSFTLEVAEVSFAADPAQASGVRAELVLRVAGREWKQVSTLNDSGPADAHYIVRMTEDGHVSVRFGDGQFGRRLPTGSNNVRVAYRKGTGLRGNLPPGSLTKPARPHALVDAARQPIHATGGNDMEGAESLRTNAPGTVLTLQRAVSLRDFGHLAASHSSVWQARAFSRPSGFARRGRVEVVVVPANGGPLGDLATTLERMLGRHGVPGVVVVVSRYTEATFDVEVEVAVDEEGFLVDDVRAAVERALDDAFSLRRRRLGQDVFLSELYRVVENVTGVLHSTIVLNGDPQLRRVPTDERSLRVLGARTVRVRGAPAAAPPGEGSPGTGGPTTENPPGPGTPGAEPPIGRRGVEVVDGVGPVYGRRLARAGAATVSALAALDPDRVSVQMPRPKLWEAVAKAQLLVRGGRIDRAAAAAVLDLRLLEVGEMTEPALRARTGATREGAAALRTAVRRLQVALVDEAFGDLTVREFVAP